MKALFIVMVFSSFIYLVYQEYPLTQYVAPWFEKEHQFLKSEDLEQTSALGFEIEQLKKSLALVTAENEALRLLLAEESDDSSIDPARVDSDSAAISPVSTSEQRREGLAQLVERMELHSLGLITE